MAGCLLDGSCCAGLLDGFIDGFRLAACLMAGLIACLLGWLCTVGCFTCIPLSVLTQKDLVAAYPLEPIWPNHPIAKMPIYNPYS